VTRVLAFAAFIGVSLHAEPLADILARMDRAAKDFKSMTAKITQTEYTAVIDEKKVSSGEVWLKRSKGLSIFREQFQEPEPQGIYFNGKQIIVYYPKANSADIIDVTKYTSKLDIDKLLLLGFGTSGADLARDYAVKSGGEETLDGILTTRLELTPKSKNLLQYTTKIELWIPQGQSHAKQIKATEPSKNYMMLNYSNIRINPSLPDSEFELKLPQSVHKNYPQR